MRRIVLLVAGLALFAALPKIALSQNQLISGVITDATGHPVVAASVIVQGTLKGTTTDADGKFKLNVPAKAGIVVSALGFASKVIKAADLSDGLQVHLAEDITHLDEVVVTGLATTIKRRNAANAVSTISSKELDGVAPAQTFDGALEGKVTGAYINANSGSPGGGISVKLRGVTSVYGATQPLYVVDGVFIDNTATSGGLNAITGAQGGGSPTSTQDNASSRVADLRPEDIDNIEILKGASAAAVYGSKAAAGVIVITTKKGKEGKTKVTASQDLGCIKVRKLVGVR
jgi:TonB-dependent starch-binding outer membrane protein SusC